MKQLQLLWPGKSPKELEERDDCRRFTLWILLVIGAVFLTVVAWGGERGSQYLKGNGYLERREPGKGQQKAKLQDKGTRCTKKGTDCCAGEKISSGGAAGEIGRRKKLYYQEISGRK